MTIQARSLQNLFSGGPADYPRDRQWAEVLLAGVSNSVCSLAFVTLTHKGSLSAWFTPLRRRCTHIYTIFQQRNHCISNSISDNIYRTLESSRIFTDASLLLHLLCPDTHLPARLVSQDFAPGTAVWSRGFGHCPLWNPPSSIRMATACIPCRWVNTGCNGIATSSVPRLAPSLQDPTVHASRSGPCRTTGPAAGSLTRVYTSARRVAISSAGAVGY